MRKARGASIEGVAADVGIDRTWLSRIERGIANPTWNIIATLADHFDVDAAELVRLAGTMPPSG